MSDSLIISAAVGSGLIAGVFFAFSTFVMRALARVAPSAGLAAMQQINVVVINPLFMTVFLGTVLCSLGCLAAAPSPPVFVGAALYVLGTFGVTMLFNVPLNNALERIQSTDADAEQRWRDYVRRWTLWNHVRTAASTGAMIAFVLAR